MPSKKIAILGAGIIGLWQAYTLKQAGHDVAIFERSKTPFTESASRLAGAMLSPYCETEAGGAIIERLGLEAMRIWQKGPVPIYDTGSLVLAPPRDFAELERFAAMTSGHEWVLDDDLYELEPELQGQFTRGLYFKHEAYVMPRTCLTQLFQRLCQLEVPIYLGSALINSKDYDLIIDCRGMGAKEDMKDLRPVRGEMAIISAKDLHFNRPLRLLHPRMPLYLVPWQKGQFMIGATMIESGDESHVSLKSALELLGAAYTLHNGFGEAEIIEFSAGLRPAFPSNHPEIHLDLPFIRVNGAYRHGFLLAPLLARMVSHYIEGGIKVEDVFQ